MSTTENPSGPEKSSATARRRYRRRLATARNVKSARRDLYAQLEANEIDVKRARAMAHVLHVLVGVIVCSDFEARIAALERAQAGGSDRPRLAS
jgi:hypothetical protein